MVGNTTADDTIVPQPKENDGNWKGFHKSNAKSVSRIFRVHLLAKQIYTRCYRMQLYADYFFNKASLREK